MEKLTIDTKDPRNKNIVHYSKVWSKVYSDGSKNYLQDALQDELDVRPQTKERAEERYGKILALQNLLSQS